VITPFFNAAPFLEEAITSVLEQSHSRIELLLVDDGSTDGSAAIARRFAEHHPERVRYLAHPRGENRGEGATRNLGMRFARGEWIAFNDADDVWLPHKLDTQLAFAFDHPEVASVWGPMEFWPPRTSSWGIETLRELGVEADRVWEAPELALRFIDKRANTPGVISALVRRESVEAIGGYDELLPVFADQVFFVRLCLREAVYVHHEPLEKYRQHTDSACARAAEAGLYDPQGGPSALHRDYLDRLELHLRADRVTDPRVWAALSRVRAPYRTESGPRNDGGAA
jgi:glycosyltransferase involved in cell wall biosynthesis